MEQHHHDSEILAVVRYLLGVGVGIGIGQEHGVAVGSESEQHYHESQAQQVLIEYYWDHNIVLLHDTIHHTVSDAKKRSIATIQLNNHATLQRNKPVARGCVATQRCPERRQDTAGMRNWQGIC